MRVIDTVDTKLIAETKDLLIEAAGKEFSSTIIFGFKEGRIHISCSSTKHSLEVLGALIAAQDEILSNWR